MSIHFLLYLYVLSIAEYLNSYVSPFILLPGVGGTLIYDDTSVGVKDVSGDVT